MIVAADLHFGLASDSVPEKDGLPSRVADTRTRFRELVAAAEEDDKFLVIAGDLFDSSSPKARVVEVVLSCMMEAAFRGITMFVLAGNHDCSTTWSATNLLRGQHKVIVIDRPTTIGLMSKEPSGCGMVLIPDVPKSVAEDYSFAPPPGGAQFHKTVLISHAQCIGVAPHTEAAMEASNAMIYDPSEDHGVDYDLVILGHIHKHCTLDNVVYPGSAIINDFGEVGEPKGYIRLSQKTLKWRWVPYKSQVRKYRVVKIDMRNKTTFEAQEHKLRALEGYILKVVVYAKDPFDVDEVHIRDVFNMYSHVSRFQVITEADQRGQVEGPEKLFAAVDWAALLEEWVENKEGLTRQDRRRAVKQGKKVLEWFEK